VEAQGFTTERTGLRGGGPGGSGGFSLSQVPPRWVPTTKAFVKGFRGGGKVRKSAPVSNGLRHVRYPLGGNEQKRGGSEKKTF